MGADDRVESLVDAWQDGYARGDDLPPEDLCRDRPDLLPEVARRVAVLRRLAGLHRPPVIGATVSVAASSGTVTAGPSDRPDGAGGIGAPPGYELLGELGRGGMGIVYKARQVGLNRLVALKMVRAGGRASAAELLRFRAEGEAVARLSHPNVVHVHEVGAHDGSPYLALEYCPGGTLEERLAGSPLPPREAAALVATIARAVHAAHAAGIVHRDLKPQNVLLAADGAPKVADFGLAKWVDAGEGLTVSGDVFGTPSYMAPEQASGQSKAIDQRADVYALGAVLYACLTARPPFKGATPLDTLDQVRRHDPAPVRSVQPGVPRDLETVCQKCLQKDPSKRYPSAAAVADDLDRFLAGRPVQARPVRVAERAWRWCRRNPAVAALLAGVVISSLTGAAAASWYAVDADTGRREADAAKADAERQTADAIRARQVAQAEKADAEKARETALQEKAKADHARQAAQKEKTEADLARGFAAQAQRRAEWAAFVSQVSLSHREWELGNAPSAFQILDATSPVLRGWEYGYLKNLYARDRKWAGRHTGGVGSLVVSPDGRRVATASDEELVLWDTVTGKIAYRVSVKVDGVRSIAFTPDGRHILTGDGDPSKGTRGRIVLWDASAGERKKELVTLPGPINDIHVDPSDGNLIVGAGDGRIYWIDFSTGRVVRSKLVQTGYPWTLRVAQCPGNDLIATGGYLQPVQIWNSTSGDLIRAVEMPAGNPPGSHSVKCLGFSPDGEFVAGAGEGLFIWAANTGKNLLAASDAVSNAQGVAWSPDGQTVATASEDRTVSVWDPRSGRRRKRLVGHLMPIHAFGVTQGAIYSASSDGAVVAWDPDSPSPVLRAPGSVWTEDIAFIPDGSGLVSANGGATGGIRLWDLRTFQSTANLTGHTDGVLAIAVRGDGAFAYSGAKDSTARVWDLRAKTCTAVLRGHSGPVTGVACPHGGAWVATAARDGGVWVWEPTAGRIERKLIDSGPPADKVVLSPDGRRLAATFLDGRVLVWDTATWRAVCQLPHSRKGGVGRTLAAAFTPDGEYLVTGAGDYRLCVWNVAAAALVREWDTGAYPVLSVAVLPGGKQFVTGGGEWATPGELKVWNTLTGENTFTLRGSSREYMAVAVRQSGGTVAACSHEGVIQLWSSDPVSQTANQALAHYNRGIRLRRGDELASAVESLREAARLEPANVIYQTALGDALAALGEFAAASRAMREAVQLNPDSDATHHELGHTLQNVGDLDAAVAAFREGIRLKPKGASEHVCLGIVLLQKADPTAAAAAFGEAVALNASSHRAYRYLGLALRETGDWAGAAAALEKAVELSPGTATYREDLDETRRWPEYDRRLPDLSAGREQPKDPGEAVRIAQFCLAACKREYRLAARLFEVAFAADKRKATELARLAAARAASQAAAGPTAPTLATDQIRLHALARSWLTAALDPIRKRALSDVPKTRADARVQLYGWLATPDLAPVRDPAQLAGLPADERKAWEALWAEVFAAIQAARPAVAPPPRPAR